MQLETQDMEQLKNQPVEPKRSSGPADGHVKTSFDEIFAGIASSSTLKQIWRGVYADDYPEEASPFSFVTSPELRLIAEALAVGAGQRFADIACGQGGPGLWVAQETGASLIGVDSSRSAVEFAADSARSRGLGGQTTFILADAAATGLPGASLDGAMSTDALQLMPDPGAVIMEVARVVKSGAVFAFTTWLSLKPVKGLAYVSDYRPLLEEAGFAVELYREPVGWERRERAVFAQILDSADSLKAEVGEAVAAMLLKEAARATDIYPLIRRINVVARKD
jgi:SAM-dependent methyltransferase